jgi:hypothetical protein
MVRGFGGNALYADRPKSVTIGILSAVFFQSFGLFYASLPGGIIMTLLLIAGYVVYYLAGPSPFAFMFFWIQPPVNIVWSIIAVTRHNKKLMKEIQGMFF